MERIDAASVNEVKLLAACFLTIQPEDKWKILAKLWELGLMRFRGIHSFLRFANWWKGPPGVFTFFKIVSDKSPETIDNWIEDTVRHIVNGKDTKDSTSVGGWSQQEIDLLLDNVTFSLLKHQKLEKQEEI